MSKTPNRFSPEVRERAVRLVLDSQGQHGSPWQAIISLSGKIGCSTQSMNEWVKKAGVDSAKRAGVSGERTGRMKALERENRELRQGEEDQKTVRVRGKAIDPGDQLTCEVVVLTNEILRKASAHSAMSVLECRSQRWPNSSTTIGMRMGSEGSSQRSGGSLALKDADLQDAADRPCHPL